jgi:hypothetical protein
MSKTWQLVDVTKISEKAPYTYYIPSRLVLDKLKERDHVKLTFSCDVENDKGWSAERMWVLVAERNGEKFKGILDNDPYYIPDIKAGDELEFDVCNILQTSLEDPVPSNVEKYSSRCYVTSSVLYDKNPVRMLLRECPEGNLENYSGWNFLSGFENEEYLNNGDYWHYVSIGAVLNIDDSFVELLDSEYEVEFVWDPSTEKYQKI